MHALLDPLQPPGIRKHSSTQAQSTGLRVFGPLHQLEHCQTSPKGFVNLFMLRTKVSGTSGCHFEISHMWQHRQIT